MTLLIGVRWTTGRLRIFADLVTCGDLFWGWDIRERYPAVGLKRL